MTDPTDPTDPTDSHNDDSEMTDEQLADASGGAAVFSDDVDVKAVIF